ncbi:hypothetical protein [Cupriavidus sp. D384]|uniref:hypothetical protein n=1 Tax=Cupriavidus sp. D384 TaxID=1538095 RepID=UPI00083282CC|nr:hypothetical protein [Cupriavidus sp. D384]
MGNSRLAANCQLPGQATGKPVLAGANGILGRIQGQYVAAATNLLPPAATATDARMEVDLDAGPDGRVRFFAEKKQVKHHRHSHYFWAVYRAEPIRSDDPI